MGEVYVCPYCKAGGFKNEAGVRVHTSKLHKAEVRATAKAFVDDFDTTQGDRNVNQFSTGDLVRLTPGNEWVGGPGPDDVGRVTAIQGADEVRVQFPAGQHEWLTESDLQHDGDAKDFEPDALVMKAPTCRVELTLLVAGTKTGEDVRDLVLRATAKWRQHGLHLTELYVSNPK